MERTPKETKPCSAKTDQDAECSETLEGVYSGLRLRRSARLPAPCRKNLRCGDYLTAQCLHRLNVKMRQSRPTKGILADSRNAELRLALGKAYVKRGEKRAPLQYERLRGLDADKAALLLEAIEA